MGGWMPKPLILRDFAYKVGGNYTERRVFSYTAGGRFSTMNHTGLPYTFLHAGITRRVAWETASRVGADSRSHKPLLAGHQGSASPGPCSF